MKYAWETQSLRTITCVEYDSVYTHSSGLVTWVTNKSCQPDLRFLE